jgi:hypothetical protein
MRKPGHCRLSLCLYSAILAANTAAAQNLDGFDSYVAQVMKDFKVPGIGVAVVQNGKIILAKGYGFRDAENRLPLTVKTLFPIASITKSFTVTTLGMLVDEGKLDWDKPVRHYLPGFRLYDPVATVSGLSIPLESHGKPIIFERTAEKQMFERTFLERFTGDYDVPGSTLSIAIRGENQLVMAFPGRPALALRPKHGTSFDIESLPGQSIEFKEKELLMYSPDDVNLFKKK